VKIEEKNELGEKLGIKFGLKCGKGSEYEIRGKLLEKPWEESFRNNHYSFSI